MAQRVVWRAGRQERLEHPRLSHFVFDALSLSGRKFYTTEQIYDQTVLRSGFLKSGHSADQCRVTQTKLGPFLGEYHRWPSCAVAQVGAAEAEIPNRHIDI